jgi:alkanesulfonate monooxygenase SsuD/methylene tetrahydromethanopterin reductase-like flavin-dependent oxidoreductase (luciferase family)
MTHLAFELRTNTPDSLTADLAERVEASGYRSLWVNHPPDEDGLGRLAKMAAATTRITLGTAVVPIGAVPPDAILRRIDETGMLPERLRLGIGSGSGPQPLRRMADAVAYLRERTPAEIVVGALGPRMRQLGATLADGVLLGSVTPELARAAAEEIRTQAKAAGAGRLRQRDGRGGPRAARRARRIRGVPDPAARLRRALQPDRHQPRADLDRGRRARRAARAARTVA